MCMLKKHPGDFLAKRSSGDDADFLVQIVCFSGEDGEKICNQPVAEGILVYGIHIKECLWNQQNVSNGICQSEVVVFFFV